MTRRGAIALAVMLASRLGAQDPGPVRGYLLNVAAWSGAAPAADAGVVDLQRTRLMVTPRAGAWQLDLAWESFITLTSHHAGAGPGAALGQASSNEWLPLQGVILSGTHAEWRHRVDRLAVRYTTPRIELTAGRQAISWATTLLLTPADPFAPFDPSDPYREYRGGVDALRAVITPSPFAALEGVVREADTPAGRRTTAVVRVRGSVHGVDLSTWGGAVMGEGAGAAGITIPLLGAALRGEAVVRRVSDSTIVRAAAGIDRSWEVAGRTLYLDLEYQHDGLGAARATDLPAVLESVPAARGELQLYGRHEVAAQASYQLHPLVGLELLALANLGDGSRLYAPAVNWSTSGTVTVRAGLFLGSGAAGTAVMPGSEYGPVPRTAYLSLAAFF